jgi:hypothetical protein
MPTDLLGVPVQAQLSEVAGDTNGLRAGVGIGIGAPIATGALALPSPGAAFDTTEPVHAALGLHEGLLQSMLSSTVADLLEQEITLSGTLGELIGSGVRALPGGSAAPVEAEGWCVAVDPRAARVARLQPGLAPLAALYLPDVEVDIGVVTGGTCAPWLEASLALVVGLDVSDGTKLGMDVAVAEGAVLSYATDGEWEEQEVVAGLGGFLGGILGLFGSQLEVDVADLAGGLVAGDDPIAGLLDGIEPRIVASQELRDETGVHPEGLYEIGLSLWP